MAITCSVLSVIGCFNALGLLGNWQGSVAILPKKVWEPPEDSGFETKNQLVHDIEDIASSKDGVYFACASSDINYSILNSISYSEHAMRTSVRYQYAEAVLIVYLLSALDLLPGAISTRPD